MKAMEESLMINVCFFSILQLYLHDESGNWTRAETDYLFELARYNLS